MNKKMHSFVDQYWNQNSVSARPGDSSHQRGKSIEIRPTHDIHTSAAQVKRLDRSFYCARDYQVKLVLC